MLLSRMGTPHTVDSILEDGTITSTVIHLIVGSKKKYGLVSYFSEML